MGGIAPWRLIATMVFMDASDKAPKVVQQVEIVQKPVRIDEHRGLAYGCSACRKIHYAPFPPEVDKGRLLGPRLTVLVAYMKGVCHCSCPTHRDRVLARHKHRCPYAISAPQSS